jgi:hypothetical protein
LPPGPPCETSAESPEVSRAICSDEFALIFIGARGSVDVWEVGMGALTAAFAFVEKGHKEKALARPGRSAAVTPMTANATMRNCWMDLIGKQRKAVGLSSTKVAYIQDISHLLRICGISRYREYSEAGLRVNRILLNLWRAIFKV